MQSQASERDAAQEHLVRHIGFAERWLARARQEVTDGRLARGILTLLLAEAEVHHARERTFPAREEVLPRSPAVMTVLGAAALLALLLGGRSLLATRVEVAPGLAPPPAVVRFRQPGIMLALVPAVLTPEETAAPPAVAAPIPRVVPQARVASPLQVKRVGRPSMRPAARPAPTPRTAAAATLTSAPPTLVSDAELIDLVIAAERSLRGERR
ncbi:MAG: hypothetical protein QN152_02730 [Armatimonadota bacterium]|nr:hypothetical protein [Armatimonadota bacterium]MDR7426461.1 hypothetical protein [Armatimonadota bacterium]MDR7465129.1 hypothetical protein [Armatimonadota bacterium]MDR7470243.1 hypothetical protein [Armatimonadota bacterium]MDR7473400.1 hypothetical protein [Armatimonadota bacterium]